MVLPRLRDVDPDGHPEMRESREDASKGRRILASFELPDVPLGHTDSDGKVTLAESLRDPSLLQGNAEVRRRVCWHRIHDPPDYLKVFNGT